MQHKEITSENKQGKNIHFLYFVIQLGTKSFNSKISAFEEMTLYIFVSKLFTLNYYLVTKQYWRNIDKLLANVGDNIGIYIVMFTF